MQEARAITVTSNHWRHGLSLAHQKGGAVTRINFADVALSALGQKQTFAPQKVMFALPPESAHVRFN